MMKVFEGWEDKILGIIVVAVMTALYIAIAMGVWQSIVEKGVG